MTITEPQRSKSYGANGGTSFDDSHDIDEWGRVQQIVVRHGHEIDAIGIVYANGNYLYHGGTGGEEQTITLQPGEFITGVNGRSGDRVNSLTFISNLKEYGPYGGNGGVEFNVAFGKNGDQDQVLLYLFGRAGSRVDQIGFGYGKQAAALPSTVEKSPSYGGTGGSPFNDLADSGNLLGKISKISVRHGKSIDSIAIDYSGASYSHGGDGGSESVFTLKDNEWVTRVTGRSGHRIDQLQFHLNSGRVSPVYGEDGGDPFDVPMNGRILKAIYGRSGSKLDQLGLFLEDAKPLKVEITSMTYKLDEFAIFDLPPYALKRMVLDNQSSTAQQVSQTTTVTIASSETTTISEIHNVGVSLTVEQEYVATSVSMTVGYSYGREYSVGKISTEERQESVELSAMVAAGQKIEAKAIAKSARFNVPWTATARITYQDLAKPIEMELNGMLAGVKVNSVTAVYENLTSQ